MAIDLKSNTSLQLKYLSNQYKRQPERAAYLESRFAEMITAIAELDAPELTGSEKQVKWANDLRAEFLFQIIQSLVLREAERLNPLTDGVTRVTRICKNLLVRKAHGSATFWIENEKSREWKPSFVAACQKLADVYKVASPDASASFTSWAEEAMNLA